MRGTVVCGVLGVALAGIVCGLAEAADPDAAPEATALLRQADSALADGDRPQALGLYTRVREMGGVTSVLAQAAAVALRLADGDRSPVRTRFEERRVLDAVVLAPDLATWCAAVSAWDEHTFFPVLLDDPLVADRFCRAFMPSEVIRLASVGGPDPDTAAFYRTVLRSWGTRAPQQAGPEGLAERLHGLGLAPRGVVITAAGAGEEAGGVALAAGRFQGLAFVELPRTGSGTTNRVARFTDQISGDEARGFAVLVDRELRAWGLPAADGWGYLTLAAGYPYSYHGTPPTWGDEYALDDALGRDADGVRQVVVGRLLGERAVAVYQAMCSLFLASRNVLAIDSYAKGGQFGTYGQEAAVGILRARVPVTALVRPGTADVRSAWAERGYGFVLINSSGMPYGWNLGGGDGSPDDMPFGTPSAFHVIHSFSVERPDLPDTVGGRALWGGAFVYVGAMHEPFLTAFVPPSMLVPRLLAGAPLGAAARRRQGEPADQAWRLVCIGDPQYAPFRADGQRGPWEPARLEPLVQAGPEPALRHACRTADAEALRSWAGATNGLTVDERAELMAALLAIHDPGGAVRVWRSGGSPARTHDAGRRLARIASGMVADRATSDHDLRALGRALAALSDSGCAEDRLGRWLEGGGALCQQQGMSPASWIEGMAGEIQGPCSTSIGTRLIDPMIDALVARPAWTEHEAGAATALALRLLKLRLPGEAAVRRMQRLTEAAAARGQPDPAVKVRRIAAREPAAAEGLAAFDAEVARQAAYGRDWLVLGPFAGNATDSLSRVEATIPGVVPGQVVAEQGRELRWEPLSWRDGVAADLRARFRQEHSHVYAAGRLVAQRASEAWLLCGSDDGLSVWIDGVQVLHDAGPHGLQPDQARVAVHVDKGQHDVLVRVDQGTGNWGFSLRLAADREGKDVVPGLRWAWPDAWGPRGLELQSLPGSRTKGQ